MNAIILGVLVPGAVGGLYRALEKVASLTQAKEIDVVKVVRAAILGAGGAYVAATTLNATGVVALFAAGYIGDRIITKLVSAADTIKN